MSEQRAESRERRAKAITILKWLPLILIYVFCLLWIAVQVYADEKPLPPPDKMELQFKAEIIKERILRYEIQIKYDFLVRQILLQEYGNILLEIQKGSEGEGS